MNHYRPLYTALGLLVLLAAFAASRSFWIVPEPETTAIRATLAGTNAEGRPSKRDAHASDPNPEPSARLHADVVPSPPSAVSAELLAVLHACMAPPELRPAPGDPLRLGIDPRLLNDCLRGSAPMDLLNKLSSSLSELAGPDREDAAFLMGYLAHQLLRSASTTAEKAAVIGPVLDGYRTIEGPYLAQITTTLLAQAYGRRDDLTGAAHEIQLALERELAAGAVPHVLGPLLRTSSEITYPARQGELDQTRVPRDAFNAMEAAAEQAIPQAIDLALAVVRSRTQPYELRDALVLLEDAFFAGSRSTKSELTRQVPGILDALAALDLNQIRDSGVRLATLSRLITQTELRLLQSGALPDPLNGVPVGGQTSPMDLRRRWGLDSPQGASRNLLDLQP